MTDDSLNRMDMVALLAEYDRRYMEKFAAQEAITNTGLASRDHTIAALVTASAEKAAAVAKVTDAAAAVQGKWGEMVLANLKDSLDALEKRIDAGLTSLEKQASTVQNIMEKRLDTMNEFRLSLSDQTNTFVPRAELDKRFSTVEDSARGLVVSLEKTTVTGLQAAQNARDALEKSMLAKFDAILHTLNAGFESRDKATIASWTSAREAVVKAETANEKRLDSVNEFRKTLSDQTNTFIPRLEVEQRFEGVDKTMDMIVKAQAIGTGRTTGLNDGWNYLAGSIGLIVAVISLALNLFRR